jgi:hypothetical protein
MFRFIAIYYPASNNAEYLISDWSVTSKINIIFNDTE